MNRQQETTILRLWRDWCRLWPEQYGHNSLQVHAGGYDPVFDVIPCQAYKDFYHEVVRNHPSLRHLNAFEVTDTALNQVRAPETTVIVDDLVLSTEAQMLEAQNAGLPADVYALEIELLKKRKQSRPVDGTSATVTNLSSVRKHKSA